MLCSAFALLFFFHGIIDRSRLDNAEPGGGRLSRRMSGAEFPPLPARPPGSRPPKPQPPPPSPWWPVAHTQAAPAPPSSSPSHLDGSDNPYVHTSPIPAPSSVKSSMGTVLLALGRCGKKLEDKTRKAGNAAGNVWHHRRPSASS